MSIFPRFYLKQSMILLTRCYTALETKYEAQMQGKWKGIPCGGRLLGAALPGLHALQITPPVMVGVAF